MKKVILLPVFGLLFQSTFAQNPMTTNSPNSVQTNPQSYDFKFFDKMKWRKIGPQCGSRTLGYTGSPGRVNEYYFGARGGVCSKIRIEIFYIN